MHYPYFTIEQRESLERLMRSRLPAEPQLARELERLHTPDYGVCEICGRDITYVRLLEQPTARRCRDCAAD